jgi:hypothetical protein
MFYLHEQFGDVFIREFVRSDEKGVERIEAAMERTGIRNADWRDVVKGFALASWLQGNGTGAYGFQQPLDPKRAAREASFTASTPGPSEGSVTLEPYGSSFHLYDSPGVMHVALPQRSSYTASAIVYDQHGTHVVDLGQGRENIIGDANDPPARVVLAFISVASEPDYLRWKVYSEGADGTAAGEPDEPVITDVHITPNPVISTGRVSFQTSVGGAVVLDLYSRSGARAATIFDGVTLDPGRYQIEFRPGNLSPDLYLARLTVGNHSVTQQLIIGER